MTITPLTRALDLVVVAVDRRNAVPILYNLLLQSDGKGTLAIETCNLDETVRVEIPWDGPAMNVTGPAHKLREIVNALGGEATLESADNATKLVVDDAYRLAALPVEDWPQVAYKEPVASFTLDRAQLLADLQAVAPAMSTEETRYYLNGIFFHVLNGNFRMVATDGHRLHYVERPLPDGAERMPHIIVSRAAIRLLIMALETVEGDSLVEVEVAELRAGFKVGNASILSKAIDGTFPDYKRVVPQVDGLNPPGAPKGAILVKASNLRQRVDEARALQSGNVRVITLDLVNMTVSSRCPESGRYLASFLAERIGDLPARIGFNGKNLSTALSPYGSAPLRLDLTDTAGPMLITSPDHPLACVMMPMRLSS